MAVALVGSGPARDAVEAALGDVNAAVADVDPGGIAGAELAVVTGQAGDPAFETADVTAREHDTPWLAVEIGGLAGYPVVEGAVSGFGPDTGCYRCLAARVRANTDPGQEPQAAPDPETARYVGAIAGRAAVRFLQQRDDTLLGTVIEVPHTERQFLPVPHCECNGDRDRTLEWTDRERDVETALAHAEIGLDERVGIVSEVGEAESFPVPYYLARIAGTSGFSDVTAARNAAGVDADWNAAFMKALGEGLERYCAGVYRTDSFEVGRPNEIENAVPPSAFVQRRNGNSDVATDGGDAADDDGEGGSTDDIEDQLDTDLDEAFDPDPDEVFEEALAEESDSGEEAAAETAETAESSPDTDSGDGEEDVFVDAKPDEDDEEGPPTSEDFWEDGEADEGVEERETTDVDEPGEDESVDSDDSADDEVAAASGEGADESEEEKVGEASDEDVEATLDADTGAELEAELDDALAETMGDDDATDDEDASAAMEASTDAPPEQEDASDDTTDAASEAEADDGDASLDDVGTMDLDGEPETVDVGDTGSAQGDDTLEVTVQGPEIEWTTGENLATGETVSLPAEFVHFPPPTEQFRPGVTTGLGLGNSTVEATLSGLYEVIERDAMMLSWYSTFEPLELSIEDDAFGTLVDRASSERLSVTPLLLTQGVDVPVVAVAVHREEWPKFALGSGAHLNPTRAATGALAEAIQNWLELRGMGRDDAATADGAIGEYAAMPERAVDFIDAPSTVPAESVGPETVPSGRAHVDAVVERLQEATLSAYVARTTTRDVAALGFEAVRVLVPAAQPLFFGDAYFGERAETVPRELGFVPRLDRPHHPFP